MRTSNWNSDTTVPEGDTRRTTWLLEIEVLTPIFGGGVEIDGHKKPIDPVTPIRVASIRGQLRFWWRAVNPRGCLTIVELRRAESEIFGGRVGSIQGAAGSETMLPSRVDCSIVKQPGVGAPLAVLEGKRDAARYKQQELSGLAYGAFPLRASAPSVDHGCLQRLQGTFSLRLSFPQSMKADIHDAVTAWLLFGGVGGRTRRGFGAIRLVSAATLEGERDFPRPSTVGEWWPLKDNVSGRGWPTIPADRSFALKEKAVGGFADEVLAHNRALFHLREFRQGNGVGRNGSRGRSFWPEADSIRKIQRRSSAKHSDPFTPGDVFPRARFGTPIEFKFLGESDGEPDKCRLRPVGHDRLASHLILRIDRGAGERFVVRALRLHHPPADYRLSWVQAGREIHTSVQTESALSFPRTAGDRNPDMHGVLDPDPIARFFKELEK